MASMSMQVSRMLSTSACSSMASTLKRQRMNGSFDSCIFLRVSLVLPPPRRPRYPAELDGSPLAPSPAASSAHVFRLICGSAGLSSKLLLKRRVDGAAQPVLPSGFVEVDVVRRRRQRTRLLALAPAHRRVPLAQVFDLGVVELLQLLLVGLQPVPQLPYKYNSE